MSFGSWARDRLAAIDEAGQRRTIVDLDTWGPVGRLSDGREVVSFASNDYLGLTTHPDVIQGARDALTRWGAGAGAARLIVGARPVHRELEEEIARWKGTEAALLFPTGFAANVGVLGTFGTDEVTIHSDALNHASVIDGCRAASASVAVFPHLDIDALEADLAATHTRSIVVTDLVFSMDGDAAPLPRLKSTCRDTGALLITDEAHAVLPFDDGGPDVEWLRVGTLSKFLGASGGFVAGSRDMVDLLINTARPFIFTTATSPADAGAALASLRIVRSDEGRHLVGRLRALVDRIAPGHPSPVIPFVTGSEASALDAAAGLLERGLLVPAIRPPSVPEGASRLRVTLSAQHTDDQVDRLVDALDALGVALDA
ncbi:MAG TPA: 8-amino-7-oxononanoate synthase [Actinomycetota bacterium]|nr:8-amino-7-oxononanoate synthase [Actinomycetota bacterium]